MLFDLFLYPGVQAVGAKSRGPNNQNASCTHRAREVARYLANRGHIGIGSTMNNKQLHAPFDINRNGKSQHYHHLRLQLSSCILYLQPLQAALFSLVILSLCKSLLKGNFL